MAHLPPQFLSAPFSGSKTLFLPSPGTSGMLVTQRGRRTSARPLQFRGGPSAALAWCLKNRAGLVFFWTEEPSVN